VDVPGAVHAHVGVDGEAVVETDHKVLSHRLDLGDGASGEALQTVWTSDPDLLALEAVSQGLGGSPDGVAFRHATLQLEQEDWRCRGEHGDGLQSKDKHCLSRRSWQPRDREKGHDWNLARHQELPEMRSRAFV